MVRRSLMQIAVYAALTHTYFNAHGAPGAASQSAPACQALRWSGATERELVRMQFGEIPRLKLVQIAWGESASDPQRSVAGLAWYYLFSTEEHAPLKKYYQALADSMGAGKFTMRGLAARYPIRKGNVKISTPLQELCDGFAVAMKAPSTNYISNYRGAPVR